LKGGRVSEEIFKCINISFSLLSPEAQTRLLVFAPFTSFLNAMFLENYLKELQAFESFSRLTLEALGGALVQGEKQGLLKEILPECYSIQPVFPFFLGEQAACAFDETNRTGLEHAFCRYMSELAPVYGQLMRSKEAVEKEMGFFLFRRDRENLYRALHRVLDNEGDFYPLYNVFSAFYHRQPLHTEAIEFMEAVVKKLDLFSTKEGDFLENYAYVVGNLGSRYMKVKDFPKARDNHKKTLTLLLKAGKREGAAAGYHQLGIVAAAERDWVEAKRNYTEALKIKQEFNDRYSQASTYHQLGMVAEEENDYASSLAYYVTALEIFSEYKDDYSLNVVIGNLSRLLSAADWDAAKAIEALETPEETKTVLRDLLEKIKKNSKQKGGKRRKGGRGERN
jgi:tetratricopeptide (TPR) repeat protein